MFRDHGDRAMHNGLSTRRNAGGGKQGRAANTRKGKFKMEVLVRDKKGKGNQAKKEKTIGFYFVRTEKRRLARETKRKAGIGERA